MSLRGPPHITLASADARCSVDSCAGTLGLRLLGQTVNLVDRPLIETGLSPSTAPAWPSGGPPS